MEISLESKDDIVETKEEISSTFKEESIGTKEETSLFITREEAEKLFIEGNIDKMESSYPLDRISNPNVIVRNIYKDGKKYLVDVNDICHVFLADYQSYGSYYNKYKNSYCFVVLKDDKHYYIDAKDFYITLADVEDYSHQYYLSNYDFKNGGLDNNSRYSGYVMEVASNGIRYLVDAEDSIKILAYGFDSVTEEDDKIIFTYSDGNT